MTQNNKKNEVLKTVIIGSGPAGLTAAIYAARAELKPVVLAGGTPGGQLMYTTEVENYPGFPDGILGPELMQKMIAQAERFGATILYETAQDIDITNRPFTVKTEKQQLRSETLVIAMGAESNWLNLPSEQRLRGKGVSSCATCDGYFFKNKEVVVAGGGDSAMEEAIFLTKFANKVTIVHRRDEFRASKIMIARAKSNPKIQFIMNSEVVEVLGNERVEGVRLNNSKNAEKTVFKTDGLFVAIGHTPNTKLLKGQIELDAQGYIVVRDNTRTNVEGVFVAGDVNDPRYKQAVSAAGMGSMAALDVEKNLAERG